MSILVYFRACPLTSILSPDGERKFGRTRDSGEATTMNILVYLPCAPPHLNPLPRGGEEVWSGRAIRWGNDSERSGLLDHACPLTSIVCG